jgi:hypothetical protein
MRIFLQAIDLNGDFDPSRLTLVQSGEYTISLSFSIAASQYIMLADLDLV